MNLIETAQANLKALAANPYPGRGIVTGMNTQGTHVIQLYWIMGRSPNSRNRVFQADDTGRLFTVAADPAKMKDPSLVIYNAMREEHGLYVVSNGDQTDTLIEEDQMDTRLVLADALRERTYEPDAPNSTSRITAAFQIGAKRAEMLILERSRFSEACDRRAYELNMNPGLGFGITTYSGDGDPLPQFRGDPILLPLGDIEETVGLYWDALEKNEHLVSMGVKGIDIETGASNIFFRNRYKQVAG